MQGSLLGAGSLLPARVSGKPRFSVHGLTWALIGAAVSLFHSTSPIDGVLFFGFVGMAMLASGAVELRRFLREEPAPLPGTAEARRRDDSGVNP